MARRALLLPGKDTLAFTGIHAMQKRVYGHRKQDAAFGHAEIQGKRLLVRGLNAPAAARICPPLGAGDRRRPAVRRERELRPRRGPVRRRGHAPLLGVRRPGRSAPLAEITATEIPSEGLSDESSEPLAPASPWRERVVKGELGSPVPQVGGVTMNETGARKGLRPRTNARARLRPKSQLTLPDEIRRALHVSEGDEIEFAVHENGIITVRGYVSVPSDQAWFFTQERLAGSQQGDEEIAAGRGTVHDSSEVMFTHLDTLGSADDLRE
jgi:antitoxin PrlF